jgi:hypothetical protein
MFTVWLVGLWLERPEWLSAVRDAALPPLRTVFDDAPRIGSLLALVLAGYTLTLPSVPPQTAVGSRWLAPLQAFGLLRDRAFVIYLLCSFAACVTFPFSTQTLPLLLRQLGVGEARVGPTLSLAQLTEVAFLVALPLLLRLLGTRRTMGLGLAAWLLAMAIVATGEPTWLVVSSLGLHGLYVTGFLIAGQVYVNELARGDLRASVQGLLNCTNGAGLLLGNFLAGGLRRVYCDDLSGTFVVAACIVGAAFALFVVGFSAKDEA